MEWVSRHCLVSIRFIHSSIAILRYSSTSFSQNKLLSSSLINEENLRSKSFISYMGRFNSNVN